MKSYPSAKLTASYESFLIFRILLPPSCRRWFVQKNCRFAALALACIRRQREEEEETLTCGRSLLPWPAIADAAADVSYFIGGKSHILPRSFLHNSSSHTYGVLDGGVRREKMAIYLWLIPSLPDLAKPRSASGTSVDLNRGPERPWLKLF